MPRWALGVASIVGAILFGCGNAPSVLAQLSPGKLHKSHAELEGLSQCTKCHALGKGVVAERCLECHSPLRRRIEANRGLHATGGFESCIKCHSDHHGREFEMIRWEGGQESFDHESTGYVLRGSHSNVDCRDCHRAEHIPKPDELRSHGKDLNWTFLGLETQCVSCHEDPHEPSLGDCTSCHDETKWENTLAFDHDRTEFPLTGRHEDVKCADCHAEAPTRFSDMAHSECSDCHQDPHVGDLGPQCSSCHQTEGWASLKKADFDHDGTRFPLRGQHVSVTCATCHASGRSVTGRLNCVDCHDDVHRGQFRMAAEARRDCKVCHNEASFTPPAFGFAEHETTRYPLTGSHRAVPCFSCHAQRGGRAVYQWERFDCEACHANPHDRSFMDAVSGPDPCGSCHATEEWALISFDHVAVGFPLEGRHIETSCAGCHFRSSDQPEASPWVHFDPLVSPHAGSGAIGVNSNVGVASGDLRFDGSPTTCAGCHVDPHGGQFASRTEAERSGPSSGSGSGSGLELESESESGSGSTRTSGSISGRATETDCGRCHGPEHWSPDRFDHERDSRFPLEGAHQNVACIDCHTTVSETGVRQFRPLETSCESCHAGESLEPNR